MTDPEQTFGEYPCACQKCWPDGIAAGDDRIECCAPKQTPPVSSLQPSVDAMTRTMSDEIQRLRNADRAEGAAEERARIVAWLRAPERAIETNDTLRCVERSILSNLAEEIERGLHE